MKRTTKLSLAIFASLSAAPAFAGQPLTGPLVLYKYNTVGDDTNDCLSAATACATFAHIAAVIRSYDLSSCEPILVQLNGNNHTDGLNWVGQFPGQCSARQVEVIGNMASPSSTLISPDRGDAVSASFGAEFAIGGFMMRNNGGGEGDVTVGQYSIVQALGQLVFLGGPNTPGFAYNDVTAGLFGTYEAVTPEPSPDAFGVQATGNYYHYGYVQCGYDSGDHGEIIFDGNGQPGFFNLFVNITVSDAFRCANNVGVVQMETLTYQGTISGIMDRTMTGGIIDSGVGP